MSDSNTESYGLRFYVTVPVAAMATVGSAVSVFVGPTWVFVVTCFIMVLAWLNFFLVFWPPHSADYQSE